MTHPLQALKHEHRIIERSLRALDGICTRIQCGDRVPAEVLLQLVDFISTFADRHHHGKEEAYLFPLLKRHGFYKGGLDAIAREHKVERELTMEMEDAIEGYRDVDPVARQRFVEAARRYSDHLLSHMDKEDAILLRLASEIVDERDKAALMDGFKRAEDELGAGGMEKYDAMASALELHWAL